MKQLELGKTIQSLRKENHMTQAELASELGVTDKAVSKWERGLSYPDISLFPALADVLGVRIDDLLMEYTDGEVPSRLLQIFRMSHDIRTPLHIILGCARMAKDNADDREKLLKYLEEISISGEYLLEVVNHVMELSSVDTGEIMPYVFSDDDTTDIPDLAGRNILVAEDMEINREIAGEMLGKTGAKAAFASDGCECVEKAVNGKYDLILMDLKMPVMDGIEAARTIRAMSGDEIPIVAMTANVSKKDRDECFAVGMNDFIEKPVSSKMLYTVLKRYM